MAFYIKANSSGGISKGGSWYTINGQKTTNTGDSSVPIIEQEPAPRHGYSSESEANSAITSLGLSGVTVVEE